MYPDEAVPGFISRTVAAKLPLENMDIAKGAGGTQHPASSWANLVHSYTSCSLTNPGDKLVALSGVAKLLQEVSGDEYLAGLWRKHLPSQLLWKRTSDQTSPLLPAQEYRAPSWSWASVDGRLSCSSWQCQCILIDILEASVEPAGVDKGGLIRSTGPLTTIELEDIKDEEIRGRYRFRVEHHAWDNYALCYPSSQVHPQRMHCLAVNKRALEKGGFAYDCLLLIPTGSRQGQFYRWGVIIIHDENEWYFNNVATHEWLEYEMSHGKGIYTISIV